MDYSMIQKLVDSAQERADRAHAKADRSKAYAALLRHNGGDDQQQMSDYHSSLNDSFYWLGHANAYRGIVAGLEIQAIVEDELEEEGSCP